MNGMLECALGRVGLVLGAKQEQRKLKKNMVVHVKEDQIRLSTAICKTALVSYCVLRYEHYATVSIIKPSFP